MDKTHLSESDICDKFIRPAMVAAGWNGMDQLYREFPLRAGRVVVRGHKAQRDKSTVRTMGRSVLVCLRRTLFTSPSPEGILPTMRLSVELRCMD